MPSGTALATLKPPFTPRAIAALEEYRRAVPRGEMVNVGQPGAVRINATEIAQASQSAWVIACHVRAAIDGMTGKDVGHFDINRYVIPSDLASKPKAVKK